MNRVKEVERINRRDLQTQLASDTAGSAGKWDVNKSWHAQYKDSAYIYVGGLPLDLSEGDVTVVFSQVGEVVDINIPRDKGTGKPRGFGFIAYEDQRSTILAVDNFNGTKLLGRTLRVDHCSDYHEEQKKNPDALPDHVTRKLSDKQLEEKKAQVAERNQQLEEQNAAKADLFATSRGTHLSAAMDEEKQIRGAIVQGKEQAAHHKRLQHIESVLARRKGEYDAAASEEARKQKLWEERKKQREVEEQAASRKSAEQRTEASSALVAAPPKASNTAKVKQATWERLMGGGGGGSKRKRKSDDEVAERRGGGVPGERKRLGEAALSVEESNKMRAELGLKPLKQ
uniref:RRM domain-containing protein n=1 Tax=Calcidiscus leptoporus TaxID=127549 RepID=A0A7S0IQV5_9EUKA|mmetsp:Transcript_18105/g.41495  ORF Transcript_18105/g.41495 Transcript_18105/m.41495 type:complete len:343 (+) Transcript_18105:163-1191(+)